MNSKVAETEIVSEYLLEDVEWQDIFDAIITIQESFQISFQDNELTK